MNRPRIPEARWLGSGPIAFHDGSVRVPDAPGLDVTLDRDALARLHDQYLFCGVRNRGDLAQMQKHASRSPASSRGSEEASVEVPGLA